MGYFAAIDVSLKLSSVCVVDETGKIIGEKKVASEPDGLAAFFRDAGLSSVESAWRRVRCHSGSMLAWRRRDFR